MLLLFSQDNNHLSIKNKAPAIETHPKTGAKVWFNHLAVSTCDNTVPVIVNYTL